MHYQIVKMIIYIVSIMIAMYGLSCFQYDKYISKGKLKEFYCLFLVLSIALGYLLASFILDFVTIHI